jgi:hypothetical protein
LRRRRRRWPEPNHPDDQEQQANRIRPSQMSLHLRLERRQANTGHLGSQPVAASRRHCLNSCHAENMPLKAQLGKKPEARTRRGGASHFLAVRHALSKGLKGRNNPAQGNVLGKTVETIKP